MSQWTDWMDDVYRLCDMLHEKLDPRKNAFRPQTNKKDMDDWHKKKRKQDTEVDSYESRRIKDVLDKYKWKWKD